MMYEKIKKSNLFIRLFDAVSTCQRNGFLKYKQTDKLMTWSAKSLGKQSHIHYVSCLKYKVSNIPIPKPFIVINKMGNSQGDYFYFYNFISI